MQKKVISFNRGKAATQIVSGIGLICCIPLAPSAFFIPIFIFGGSLIYFGQKSISSAPQIIISEEGLYFGFKFKKTIAWHRIVKVTVKNKKVDFRTITFIEVVVKMKTNAPSDKRVYEFPLENLDTQPFDIFEPIDNYLWKQKSEAANEKPERA